MNFTPVAIWRTVTSGLRRMMNSETSDREISDEMEHFIEQATRDGISRGLAPSAAKREAQIALATPHM
jgi:hypothetical protein